MLLLFFSEEDNDGIEREEETTGKMTIRDAEVTEHALRTAVAQVPQQYIKYQ